MRKIKNLLLMLLTVAIFASCSRVPAGTVGIKFHLLGSEKGVDYDVLKPGRYYIGWNEELFLFETFNQTQIWTSDVREGSENDDDFNFQSSGGLKLSSSVSIEYHVKPENVPSIFEKYKVGLDEVTNKVLRNSLRDAFNIEASTRTAEQMYGKGKTEFMAAVTTRAKVEANERGITIDDVYLIGNIVVPSSITTALNAKIEADQLAQQKETELRATVADAKKVTAKADGDAQALVTMATAEAKANKILNASISPNLLKYNKIEKWDGILPKVSGSGATIISLKE